MQAYSSIRLLTNIVLILLAGSLTEWAQETRGSIIGRIADATDGVVPAVAVRATNLATKVTVATESTADGLFEIPFLLPGKYRLTAELAGFKTSVREPIELRIGEKVSINVRMEVGNVSEKMTVTAEAPLLESATASVGQVIDQKRFSDLPIAHGNPFLLMGLSGGVVFTRNPALDRPFEPGHFAAYAMDGVRENHSEISLDGAPNTFSMSRFVPGAIFTGYSPPADLIQEFKVQTVNYDASSGHSQGGVTSITIKSGGNDFHGTGYWSLLRPGLDANLFFANLGGVPRPEYSYNRWGATLTGPIILPKVYNGKNRTFVSFGYEAISEARPRGGMFTVPSDKERQGDFSDLLKVGANYQIYDPFTRVPVAGGRFQLQPLPNNTIPPNRINPVARNVISYYAKPNTTGEIDGTNNLNRANAKEDIDYYNYIGRIDHNLSEKHRIYGRVNTYCRYGMSSDWYETIASGTYTDWLQKAATFDDVYTFNPSTLLNVRYSFFDMSVAQYPKPETNGFDLTSLGFPKNLNDAIDPGIRSFPYFNIADYGETGLSRWNAADLNHTVEGSVTMIRGSHTWKVGGDTRVLRQFQYNPSTSSSGSYTFTSTWSRGPFNNSASSPRGQAAADFLFGLPSSGQVDNVASFAQQSTVFSGYAQDDWRVSPKLTLTLGLRYEIEGATTERFNRSVRGYDFQTPSPLNDQVRAKYAANPIPEVSASQFRLVGGLLFAGVNGQPRELFNKDANNLMPRVGFAYQVWPHTVVRGGYGVSVGPLGVQRADVNQIGFSVATQHVATVDNGLTFIATLSDPFPNGILQPRGAADGLSTFLGRGVSFFNENPRAPIQQRWSLSVQREFRQRVMIDVSYVGNHGSSIETQRDFRPLPVGYLSRSPLRDQNQINYLTAQVPNPFYPLLSGTGLSGQTVARSFLLSSGDYPHFTSMTSTDYAGYSWYHSLQARAEKRLSAGWTLNAAYTWSKAMEATSRLNGYLSPLEYVIADFDRPHRFALSGVWELPFGKGRMLLGSASPIANGLAGGWQIQGIWSVQSGAALGFGNVLFIGDIHDIALPRSQRTVDRWFNTDAGFNRKSPEQLASNYRTFPSRLSGVRGDGIDNVDLSVIKNTEIREGVKFQFRAEALNALNHPQFSYYNPNTNPVSSAFAKMTRDSGYARRIQLSLRLVF